MPHRFHILMLLGCCLLWAPHAAAFTARINKPIIQETVAPSQTANGTIEVENEGAQPVQFTVYLQDWEYVDGGSGDKLFSTPGSSPWSASGWISYYPQQLELPAHGKGVVEYTIRVPSGTPGGRYAVLFFESALGHSVPDKEGVTVQYAGRLGSLIEVEVAGTVERTGELTAITLGQPAEDRPLEVSYTFLNTGNVAIRPKAYFNITDASGRYFGRGEFPPVYTFPGRSGTAKTEWIGSLPPGDYSVLLTVDLGQSRVLVEERPLHVPSS
ncbi:MAG: hypothetical protein HY599_01535 [Candidatus Omnitrophica bacterium]|nr:hypothetical protein [Candidatus Omnitrophota bacterium]